MNRKVKMVCDRCGGDDVSAEVTSVRWSVERQQWEVAGDVCDKGHYCGDCEGECRIEPVELAP